MIGMSGVRLARSTGVAGKYSAAQDEGDRGREANRRTDYRIILERRGTWIRSALPRVSGL